MSFKINKLYLASMLFLFSNGFSDVKTWDSGISGSSWNYGDHWMDSAIPGANDIARFETISKFPKKQLMVSIIAPSAIGGLEFNNTNPETSYYLFGKVPLKLESPASIVVSETNQNITKIDVPLVLTKDLNVFNRGSHRLSLAGKISGKEKNINVYGPGEVELSGEEDNTFSGTLEIQGAKVLLNKKKGLTAFSGNANIHSGELEILEDTQLSKNASVSLIGSSGHASLNIGSHKETMENLHLHYTPFTNKVVIGTDGEIAVFGNVSHSVFLSDHTTIEGDGKLIFAGETTGLTFKGIGGKGEINTHVDLQGKNRSFMVDSSSLIVGGKITNGGLTKEGLGTLVLKAENTYEGGTLIKEGSLEATTKTLPGNVETRGLLHLNQNFDGTPQGIISGSGSLLKTGSGTLHLSQASPFTGKTNIQEGSLNTTTRSLSGDIQNDGFLTFNQDFDGLFSSKLAGSGTITKLGRGNITFLADNPFKGTMFVTEGSLQGTTKSLQGHIVNASSITIDQNFDGTHASTIGGQGVFIKKGTGAVALTQRNTHKGSFLLSSGKLILGHNEALGSSSLNMSHETILALAPNLFIANSIDLEKGTTASLHVPLGSSSIAGNVSGGTFIKTGSGSLRLSGMGILESLVLAKGALEIHGNVTTANPLEVQPTALLVGTGKVHGNVDIKGTLSGGKIVPETVPFDREKALEYFSFEKPLEEETSSDELYLVGDFSSRSVSGKVNIEGDVSLSNESTLLVNFNPNSFSQVHVDGTLTLDSPTLQLDPYAGTYKAGQTYKILEADKIEGEFGNIVTPFPMLKPIISYNADAGNVSILFQLATHHFSNIFKTGNPGQVAGCLDFLEEHPCENSKTVIDALINTHPEERVRKALEQMQPSQLTSLSVVQENDLFYVRNAIYQRLKGTQKACNVGPVPEKQPVSFWGSFFGGYTTQENQGGDPGYLAKSPGIVFGVDAEVREGTTVGGGVSYAYTRHDWNKNRGDANIHNIYACSYGQYTGGLGYVEAALLGGYSFYDVERKITFGPFDATKATAKSDFGGAEGSFDLKTGLRFPFDTFSISPFVGLDYMLVHLNSFKERGARSLNLKVKSHLADLFTSEGGIEFDFCQRKETTFLKAFIRLSAIVETRFFGDDAKSSFVCGCSMKTHGFYPTRILAGLGAGISAAFGRNVFSAAYQAKSQWQFTDQSMSFQYLWKF